MKAKFKTNPEQFNVLSYVDEFEITTKEIMSEAFTLADTLPHSNIQRCLAKAFVAAHSAAQTAVRWHAIAEALNNAKLDTGDTQAVLTRMTRKGYLRSRQNCGFTLYEVNF